MGSSRPLFAVRVQLTRHLRTDEKVLWSGRPEIIPFFVPDAFAVFIALQGLVFLYGTRFLGDFLAQRLGQVVGQIIGLLPFVVGLGSLILLLSRDYLRYRNTEYLITDQRLIAQTGASRRTVFIDLNMVKKAYVKAGQVDSLVGTGTLIVLADGFDSALSLISLKKPREAQKLLLGGNQLILSQEKLEPAPPSSSTLPKDEAESIDQPQPGILGKMKHVKNRLVHYYEEQMDAWLGKTELLDAVHERLQGIGVNTTLLEHRSLVSILPNYGYTLGCFAVEGREIDLVHVGWLSRSRGGGEDSPPAYTTRVFLLNYVVRVSKDVSGNELEADFGPFTRRTGTILREVEVAGFRWTGRELAETLSKDPDLSRMMLNLGLGRLEIRVDRRRGPDPFNPKVKRDWGAAIITPISPLVNRAIAKGGLRDFPTVGREDLPTLEAFEAYERIAQHIRNVASTSQRRE